MFFFLFLFFFLFFVFFFLFVFLDFILLSSSLFAFLHLLYSRFFIFFSSNLLLLLLQMGVGRGLFLRFSMPSHGFLGWQRASLERRFRHHHARVRGTQQSHHLLGLLRRSRAGLRNGWPPGFSKSRFAIAAAAASSRLLQSRRRRRIRSRQERRHPPILRGHRSIHGIDPIRICAGHFFVKRKQSRGKKKKQNKLILCKKRRTRQQQHWR